jgi:hypothetical protein
VGSPGAEAGVLTRRPSSPSAAGGDSRGGGQASSRGAATLGRLISSGEEISAGPAGGSGAKVPRGSMRWSTGGILEN